MKFVYTEEELNVFGDKVKCAICKTKYCINFKNSGTIRLSCSSSPCSSISFYYDENLQEYANVGWFYFLKKSYNYDVAISYHNKTNPYVIYICIANNGKYIDQITIPYVDFYNLDDSFFQQIIKRCQAHLLLQ